MKLESCRQIPVAPPPALQWIVLLIGISASSITTTTLYYAPYPPFAPHASSCILYSYLLLPRKLARLEQAVQRGGAQEGQHRERVAGIDLVLDPLVRLLREEALGST